MENMKRLTPEQREYLIRVLKGRFEKNMNRHTGKAGCARWRSKTVVAQ